MSPGRRNIVGLDLCTLILAGRQRIERVWILEPGPRVAPIKVHGVRTRKLQVHAVKYVLLVTFGMNDLEFRRIEETTRVQAIRRDEIAPLLPPKGHVKAPVH